jgi:hypothetical protein
MQFCANTNESNKVSSSLSKQLKFRVIRGSFAICQLPAADPIPSWAMTGSFTSVTRTSEELSIVCPLDNVPPQHKPQTPWIGLKIEGPFAFSQVGILHSFIQPLAANGVPIFAVATFDTDYVLIQETFFAQALRALQSAGHEQLPDK